jgi:NAD-dependent SIR2 family protein deacetylase
MTNTEHLAHFLERCPRLLVLGGAGISEASGLPTYRDRKGVWRHRTPIQHRDFLREQRTRQRYWARSMVGWPAVRDAQPNDAHRHLAALEQAGHVELLVTQNVDRLHQRAGSTRVIDLHGRLDRVVCLDCASIIEREELQRRLLALNPALCVAPGAPRPDGDRDLPDHELAGFSVPACKRCQGTLMPDVVFFGGTVPRARVDSAMDALRRADGLLAVGSSLQVYSGYRFCRQAAALGKPIAIVNPGPTRADELASLRLYQGASEALAQATDSMRLR